MVHPFQKGKKAEIIKIDDNEHGNYSNKSNPHYSKTLKEKHEIVTFFSSIVGVDDILSAIISAKDISSSSSFCCL
jgi:hypothetical protein